MVVAGIGLLMIVVAGLVIARARAQVGPVRAVDAMHHDGLHDHDDENDAELAPVEGWKARDIDPEEAAMWAERGFDADHAYLLRSMDVDPDTAATLRGAGLDDSAIVALVEDASFRHRTRLDDLVALVRRAPHLAAQAAAWLANGASMDHALRFASEGFTPEASHPWRDAGWELEDALPWFVARFEPSAAATWRAQGFAAEQAAPWKAEHFGVKQAAEWRRLGDTPARARAVEKQFADAKVTVADGLRWLERGFSVEEICAGWQELGDGNVNAWRGEWQSFSFAPAEVTAWRSQFDQDEAMRWVDAGLRDPAAAARLRNRGVDPTQVSDLAGRLAEVFDAVPVTRDDLLSAAGQLARAGGSPDVRHRLQIAAAQNPNGDPKEVSAGLIEDVLDEIHRLDELGALGAPNAARALARRLEQGLIMSALITGRAERLRTERTSN